MRETEPRRAPTLAAMGGVLTGIGLARFAYTPLVSALIDAAWLTPAAAAYGDALHLAIATNDAGIAVSA